MAYNPRSGFSGNGGRIFYLSPSISSGIAGYKLAGVYPSAAAEQTIVTNNTGTGDTLIGSFCTPLLQPDIHSLPAGLAYRNIWCKTDGASAVARMKMELYQRTALGIETLLRSSYSMNFFGTDEQMIHWIYADAFDHTLALLDRIVFKLYVARVSGGSGSVLTTIFFEGVDRASHIVTTVDLYTGS